MRYIVLLFILVSCKPDSQSKNNKLIFESFHNAFENRDYVLIDSLLTDSFISISVFSGDTSSKASYMKYLQAWNNTFQTKWNVVSVSEYKTEIESIEYDTDIYNDYFFEGIVEL